MTTRHHPFSPSLHNTALQPLRALTIFTLMFFTANLTTIPWMPVPVSLQLLVVLLCGFTQKPLTALVGVGTYTCFALVLGYPFSAGNIGHTGGYLVGFVLAATGMAYMWQDMAKAPFLLKMAGALVLALLGTSTVHLLGVAWLHNSLRALNPEQTWEMSLALGVVPFIGIDLAKCLLAAAVASYLAYRRS